MIKKNSNLILWLIAAAVIMLLLPWTAVTFVRGDAGMAVCFLLFYAVNPVYMVFAGIYAGKNGRKLWSLPVVAAGLFLLGTGAFFSMGEPAFVMYAGVYLVLGISAMLLSMFVRWKGSARL